METVPMSTMQKHGMHSETIKGQRSVAMLRRVLQVNGATSALSGLVMLVAAAPLGRWLEVSGWIVAALGFGLVVFAIDVLMLSRASDATMVSRSLLASLGDLAWVGGTIVVVAAGLVSTGGAVAMAVVGLVVLDYGVTQLVLRRRVAGLT